MKDFKFAIGEKVKVRDSGREGAIVGRTYEENELKGSIKVIIKYTVNHGLYNKQWFTEEQLTRSGEYEFNDNFEKRFLDLVIDANLVHGSFENINTWQQEKSKYIRDDN